MKHCILVKWNKAVTDKVTIESNAKKLFSNALLLPEMSVQRFFKSRQAHGHFRAYQGNGKRRYRIYVHFHVENDVPRRRSRRVRFFRKEREARFAAHGSAEHIIRQDKSAPPRKILRHGGKRQSAHEASRGCA